MVNLSRLFIGDLLEKILRKRPEFKVTRQGDGFSQTASSIG
jgi:hypothetical protein